MKRIANGILAGALAMVAGHGGAIAQQAGSLDPRSPELAYTVEEGDNLNAFVRAGPVAAHLLLRNGTDPRILVAFPAGNSGVGLWFTSLSRAATWRPLRAPQPIALNDPRGRRLNGVRAEAAIDAAQLTIKQAVLSNVRFLRDYQAVGRFPPEVAVAPRIERNRLIWSRDRVDGAAGYRLEVEVIAGSIRDGRIVANGGPIRLAIVAATGDAPLTGLTETELLGPRAANDPVARNALRFLSYREKFLAGSWRFNTYFGRDTLMSLRLLMPALQPPAIEAGLGAVLSRLASDGDVAHEEGLSEFAIIDRRQHADAGKPAGGDDAAPTLDYAMIDDDYMLAPVASAYLLDHAKPAAARAFLARPIPIVARPGFTEPAGAALMRNLRFVLTHARAFAADPRVSNLLQLKAGRMTGEWRDSEEGLGRGRIPYDVNAVLIPAALEAAARLHQQGLLDTYMTAADRVAFAQATPMANAWRTHAPAMFRVTMPSALATTLVRRYADRLKVPAAPALGALGDQPLTFHAIALDADGRAVPIINSDEGFELLFGQPTAADLDTYVTALARPFPAGLMTDVGLLVANAALADPVVQDRFAPSAYHGAVVWSWQQALFAAGLERQLARSDLPATTRATLEQVQARLWRAITATRAVQSSELWSWAFSDGRYHVVPFGAGKQDVDEANAAQLWSTVYLAVQPPAARVSAPTGKR